MLHKALQDHRTRLLFGVLGTFLYAIGVNFFIVPMGLYSGGITGVSQVLRTLLSRAVALPEGVDVAGILYFILNVPILILAWRALGRGFLCRTLLCTGSSSFFLSVLRSPATPILEERLACCMVGGILCGVGLGLTLTCGCSSGGLDVVGLWLAKKGSSFSVGRFSISFNVLLYTACALLFDLQTALYSIIYNVFSSLFTDRMHQQGRTSQVLIFTHDRNIDLAQHVLTRLNRGVSYWEGKGAYTGKDIRVLCICVSKFEEQELRDIVHEVDPHAFITIQDGVRISGNFVRKLS